MPNVGKQTKKSGNKFGGEWTVEKLEIIEKYVAFYIKTMEKQTWAKKVYIDAFSGSGETELPDGTVLQGSPTIALKYDFETYYFIEYDVDRIEKLRNYIKINFASKVDKVKFIQGDCNEELPKLFDILSKDSTVRGVMFLDPYALELKWETLQKAKAVKLDIWYLFPLMAVNRLLEKTKKIPNYLRIKLDKLIGDVDELENKMYKENPQISLFDEIIFDKQPIQELIKYIVEKLKNLFGYQPPNRIFKNDKNSPLFLLCLMITNDSKRAIELSKRVATDIFTKINKNKLGVT